MFKCQRCGIQVPRGVPAKKRVTRKRPRVYTQIWVRAKNTEENKTKYAHRNLPRSKDGGKRQGKPRFIEVLVPQHTGWEIAEEKRMCRTCFLAD